MVEHASLISEFKSIVNCNEQLAQFYLEANNWDLAGALTAYYENPPPSSDIDQATNTASGSNQQESQASSSQNNPSSSSRTNINSSRFATIHDLENEPMDEDDDEDDENKNLFAGGEKSGIFMQNPNAKPIKQASSLVTDILKKATEGSRAHTEEPEVAASSSTSSQVFTGTGYRLGSDEEPSTIIPGTSSDNNTEEEEPATTVRHLTFWRNGFSVEDGPLMAYDDPENQEFLKAIRSGRAPLSLLNVSQNQPVDVRVSRRLDEDYKPPPKKPVRPFSGSGQRLGSITPVVVSSQSTETGILNTDTSTDTATSTSTTQSIREFEVDESLPVTSLQIRLGDGTRMLARFNHTHTVNDIRNFINASRVGEAQRNYLLQTTFPVKDLNDGSQTLEDASLLNSVVIQRYI